MAFFVQLLTNPVGFYNQHELLIAQIGINAILAIAIFVTFYSGQLTLANAGFMAIGAYTTVIMSLYLPTPLPLDMLVGALLAGLISVVVGLPVLRLRGVFLAIATIGFVEALRLGVILNVPITGEGQGLHNPSADPLGGIVPILTALPEIVRQFATYRDVVNGVILILVIIFRPQGIVGRGGLAIIKPRWWIRWRAHERPAAAH